MAVGKVVGLSGGGLLRNVLMDAACGVHKVVSCVPLCGAPQMASTTTDAGRAVLLKASRFEGGLLRDRDLYSASP